MAYTIQKDCVKIGIVLPQDQQTSVSFCTPAQRRMSAINLTKQYPLAPNTQYKAILSGAGMLTLQVISNPGLDAVQLLLPVYIVGEGEVSVEPKDCLTLFGVVTGRNFHWQNKITEDLPGDFEITVQDHYFTMANILPLNVYLLCVAASEMSPECPPELVKAQIIAARSWLLAHSENKHPGWDACNDDCCQRYQGLGKIKGNLWTIADSVKDVVLTYNDQVCDARYSKSCGGVTEAAEMIWPEVKQPYLVSIYDAAENKPHSGHSKIPHKSSAIPAASFQLTTDAGMQAWLQNTSPCFCSPTMVPLEKLSKYLGMVDVADQYYRWEQKYSATELEELLRSKLQLQHLKKILRFSILNRGHSGRIHRLQIDYEDEQGQPQTHTLTSEYSIRAAFHLKFLYSSAFIIKEERNAQQDLLSISLQGAGWGHGVGLCQIGALGMALSNCSYTEILTHYFKGAKISHWSLETCIKILRKKNKV